MAVVENPGRPGRRDRRRRRDPPERRHRLDRPQAPLPGAGRGAPLLTIRRSGRRGRTRRAWSGRATRPAASTRRPRSSARPAGRLPAGRRHRRRRPRPASPEFLRSIPASHAPRASGSGFFVRRSRREPGLLGKRPGSGATRSGRALAEANWRCLLDWIGGPRRPVLEASPRSSTSIGEAAIDPAAHLAPSPRIGAGRTGKVGPRVAVPLMRAPAGRVHGAGGRTTSGRTSGHGEPTRSRSGSTRCSGSPRRRTRAVSAGSPSWPSRSTPWNRPSKPRPTTSSRPGAQPCAQGPAGRLAQRPARRGVRPGPRGRQADRQAAALRRPAHRRRGDPLPLPGRDGDGRREDPGRHPAGLPERPGGQGRPRHHRQRLPRPARRRLQHPDLQDARHDRRRRSRPASPTPSAAPPTPATSPTAPARSSASTSSATS